MSKIMRGAGDRLLGMFLPSATAGACVPNIGEPCTTCTCVRVSGRTVCYRNVHSCTGPCVRGSSCCC